MNLAGRFGVISKLAWRNLFSNKGKNIIVGLIMCFGSFLVVLGTSLLDSIERSMTRSVTASIAGHFQVYDQDAQDDLALFGGGFMGTEDIGSIPDFARVKTTLVEVPNVKAVVPMGIEMAEFYLQTELDKNIEKLRLAVSNRDLDGMQRLEEKIRTQAKMLKQELINRKAVLDIREEIEAQIGYVDVVLSDEFWRMLPSEPEKQLMFLDTKMAPLVDEYEHVFLRYLGTDLHEFAKHFNTFEIVQGQMVPQGERGLLINQDFYNDVVRNRVARQLDDLYREVYEKGKKIATDAVLQNQVERLVRQYRRITFQLESRQAEILTTELGNYLQSPKDNIEELIQEFLRVDDANIADRHAFFFENIAPKIKLYLFDVGDVITIRTYTKSGYIKSVNIKVFGTFKFKGLERSILAGSHNLIDMLTFRDLYGKMTRDKLAELETIRNEVGLREVPADTAEEDLFGEVDRVEAEKAQDRGFDEFADVDLKPLRANDRLIELPRYTQAEIDHGLALNAAVVLEDPDKMSQTRPLLEKAIKENGLGLKLVDWQQASGIVGQLVVLVRIVLYVATFIIFVVALVIINNTMIMATMERMIEIGTIRAMGGYRSFVMLMFLLETLMLSMGAGLLGTLLGAGFVKHLGREGIPAVHDFLVFMFSGPRLYPSVGAHNLIFAWMVVLVVCLLATFYPAFIATRIQPIVAMQGKE